jgi:hypothetical protein
MRFLSRLCTAVALTLLGAPLDAQKGRNHADKAQAELHINVIVAPAVFPPHHKHKDKDRDKDGDEAGVTYILPASVEKFSVTEETRSMLVDGLKHEQVQLKTIVMQ